MKKSDRQYDVFLEDMLTSMKRIEEYIEGMSFNKFKINYMAVDAVVRNLEIIGEASRNIPDEIKIKYPEIPWGKMYGLRNRVTHDYFGLDYEIIWEIITNQLPYNRLDLEKVIKNEKDIKK